ncbi:MAG: hypothetical protein RRY40_00125 [Oscillospiraceae bacterium]
MKYQTLVREVCRNYKANKKELGQGGALPSYPCSGGSFAESHPKNGQKMGKKGSPVENALLSAVDERRKRLLNEVAAVEWGFSILEAISKNKSESEKTRHAAKAALAAAKDLYFLGASPCKAAYNANCSVETLYRYLRPFHRLVGGKMGLL